jgi:hypothetical protein
MRRLWKTLALASALSLGLAACSAGARDDGVATLGDAEGSGAKASASPSVDPEDALAEFAECMRDNGIEDFPDPQIDENGGITISGPAGGDEGPPSDQDIEDLEAAMEACQDLLPQGLGPGEISQEDQAAFQDAMLEYAQCMRDQGIDFPDPDFSEGGGFIGGAEGFDPEDPDFQAADEVCRPILDDVFDGQGPGGGTVEQSN